MLHAACLHATCCRHRIGRCSKNDGPPCLHPILTPHWLMTQCEQLHSCPTSPVIEFLSLVDGLEPSQNLWFPEMWSIFTRLKRGRLALVGTGPLAVTVMLAGEPGLVNQGNQPRLGSLLRQSQASPSGESPPVVLRITGLLFPISSKQHIPSAAACRIFQSVEVS